MEKEKDRELGNILRACLEIEPIEMKSSSGAPVSVNCYFEPKVIDTDRCFAYECKNILRLFQISLHKSNKNLGEMALSLIDFEDPEVLADLVYAGRQIISEEPIEIKNARDLSTEIEFDGNTFVMIHQSSEVRKSGTSLFENYANRVIERNT